MSQNGTIKGTEQKLENNANSYCVYTGIHSYIQAQHVNKLTFILCLVLFNGFKS